MPESPDRIQPFRESADRPSTFEERKDKEARKFYQTYTWRKFRNKMKRKHRAIDSKRVHDLYKELTKTTFRSYMNWLAGDDPLCVDCVDEGYIRPAKVADHKKRIRDGGKPLDPKNIQWLCSHHHNIKSGKEAHE